jgi:hypothetical protein
MVQTILAPLLLLVWIASLPITRLFILHIFIYLNILPLGVILCEQQRTENPKSIAQGNTLCNVNP